MNAGALKLAAQVAAVALVAALLGLLAWRVATAGGSGVADDIQAGRKPAAPLFELERLDGKGTLSLESLRGKAVVINFWASWCEPCRNEAPVLERAWREYRDQGLVVVGVDYQDFKDDARRFARENGMTYPLVHDGPGKVLDAYDGTAVPETFFVDRNGRLVGERLIGEINTDEDRERFERGIELALQS